MAIIKSVRGYTPVIGENTFLADNATVIGDATIGRDCSIWFSAVVRGDVNTITIGDRVNIQDGAVIHTLYQRSVTEIGNDVSIGHNANIHGAKIEDKCLIGMGATVLDPHGYDYYWMTGNYRNDEPEATDTDNWALTHGYVAITPTRIDVTDYETLKNFEF